MKISDADADLTIDGTEQIPVNNGGNPARVDTGQIKNYTIDEIEGIGAAGSVSAADGVYILQGGVLKPVNIDIIAQHVVDVVWGGSEELSLADSHELLLDNGVAKKVIGLDTLVDYVQAEISGNVLDISGLPDASPPFDAVDDYILVTEGTTAKKVVVSVLLDGVHEAFAEWMNDPLNVPEETTPDGTEKFFVVIAGDNARYMTLEDIKTYAQGGSAVTGTGAVDLLAQWDSTSTVTAGPTVLDGTGPGFDVGSANVIPTTLAIRNEMNEIVDDAVDVPGDLEPADTFLMYDDDASNQRKASMLRIWRAVRKYVANSFALGVQEMSATFADDDRVCIVDVSEPDDIDRFKYLRWEYFVAQMKNAFSSGVLTGSEFEDTDTMYIFDDSDINNLKISTLEEVKKGFLDESRWESVWVPASDMEPSITNGADALNTEIGGLTYQVMSFDGSAGTAVDTHAEFDLVLPKEWNSIQDIYFQVYWTNGNAASSLTDEVEFYLAAASRGHDESLGGALGTAVAAKDVLQNLSNLHITGAFQLALGGTPARMEHIHFKLSRDYDHDDGGTPGVAMAEEAYVLGVLVIFKNPARGTENVSS